VAVTSDVGIVSEVVRSFTVTGASCVEVEAGGEETEAVVLVELELELESVTAGGGSLLVVENPALGPEEPPVAPKLKEPGAGGRGAGEAVALNPPKEKMGAAGEAWLSV
jgi:hypothetical protein